MDQMGPLELADRNLRAASRGDVDAFARFFSGNAETVLRYFATRVNDPEVAADLMAETFAAALLAVRRYRQTRDGSALAWLFAIAHSKLIDGARRGRVDSRARTRLALEPVALEDADLERVCELADLERRAPTLPTLINGLPPEQREALLARVVAERDYREIATDMRCSEAVVRKRVSRALDHLRRAIGSAT
jgi:RNA polymerase sigma factor (sigma-70 family)